MEHISLEKYTLHMHTHRTQYTYTHTVDIPNTIFQVNLQIQGTHTHSHIPQHTDKKILQILMVMCCQAAILLHSLCSIIFLFLPPSRPLSKCVCVKVVFSTATPPVSNRFLCFSMCLCRLVQCAYCIWKVAKNAWIYGFLDLLVLGISPLPLPSARSQNALNVHNKQIWLL